MCDEQDLAAPVHRDVAESMEQPATDGHVTVVALIRVEQ